MATSLGRCRLLMSNAAQSKNMASPAMASPSSVAMERIKADGHAGVNMGSGQILHALPKKTVNPIGKAMRWWEKGIQPNMKEVDSVQDLVESLTAAGNKLVIVEFFSPGCGGCKALHPKICQFAEMNPEMEFLQVNYEDHKSMCYSLNVHVLPFFRFYRGAQGRVCSFSCTNATVKKFRDALAKHGTERCSLGPARGLEESELQALEGNRDLSFTFTRRPEPVLPYYPHQLEQMQDLLQH